ncbi:hypothetical protein EPN95_04100 [Patescibacteria group bacterium]|nr:MAG: hypothetical protein EPN95_04100 [Patescibacteria group bacterium]
MLLAGSQLIQTPVLSLQTGAKLAVANIPLIDPTNLKIVAYVLEGPLLTEQPSLLRTDDIRELSTIGMIVDSSDEFIGLEDVIKIEKLYHLGFNLLGMNVVDETKHKLGKVEDYSVESDNFVIQQLNVKRGILKALTETSLLVHRSQIVEINDHNIIVRTTAKKLEAVAKPERLSYVNPFRSSSPQAENSDV